MSNVSKKHQQRNRLRIHAARHFQRSYNRYALRVGMSSLCQLYLFRRGQYRVQLIKHFEGV